MDENMQSWEDKIFDMQESIEDDCKNCPYKGSKCRNQCLNTD